ncbi:unnamed protein product [Trichogramma brassicae]|uniref:Ras-GEF domain-containing protein n=1 Tax=Trichogramma brassicae TaxID=86971 RepID=A0A6H5J6N8_9HYME|nr:unnamed protein product [Trichogramma brassicae]
MFQSVIHTVKFIFNLGVTVCSFSAIISRWELHEFACRSPSRTGLKAVVKKEARERTVWQNINYYVSASSDFVRQPIPQARSSNSERVAGTVRIGPDDDQPQLVSPRVARLQEFRGTRNQSTNITRASVREAKGKRRGAHSKLTAAALSGGGGAANSASSGGSGCSPQQLQSNSNNSPDQPGTSSSSSATCRCAEKQKQQQQQQAKQHKSPKKRHYERLPPQKHHPSRHRGNSLPPPAIAKPVKTPTTPEHHQYKTNSLPRTNRGKITKNSAIRHLAPTRQQQQHRQRFEYLTYMRGACQQMCLHNISYGAHPKTTTTANINSSNNNCGCARYGTPGRPVISAAPPTAAGIAAEVAENIYMNVYSSSCASKKDEKGELQSLQQYDKILHHNLLMYSRVNLESAYNVRRPYARDIHSCTDAHTHTYNTNGEILFTRKTWQINGRARLESEGGGAHQKVFMYFGWPPQTIRRHRRASRSDTHYYTHIAVYTQNSREKSLMSYAINPPLISFRSGATKAATRPPYTPIVRQCIYLYARSREPKTNEAKRRPDRKLARNFRACTQRWKTSRLIFHIYARSNLLGKLFRISDRTKRCVSCKSLKAYITGLAFFKKKKKTKQHRRTHVRTRNSRICERIGTRAQPSELVYRDGNLVSGSLEALVQHMVPTEDYYPDRAYLFAFLLSARLFIKPHELLGEVCALCEHQQNLNGEGGKERLHRFVPRLVQLLTEWTETFPYDFRDERVMGHVRNITQKVANVDAAARQEVSVLLQNLLVKFTALERYEEALSRLANEATTEPLAQVDVTELCPSATVLAQQLTHIELERLSYIGPEEFVQAFAKVSESAHLETSFKDMKKTRNLESYVQWFNRLSYFVATEVCKHAKKKQRVRVVEYWIEAARECFNIGNFNSLMAIIAGLNMSPISRLKKTWSKVQSAKFSILETQMDPTGNFSSYRSTLKAAMWRSAGATDERQRIVVPFFSLLVKDLYFLNEGCSNKLPNGHINFEKFWQLAKQVTEFIAWKQVACPFEKNTRVIAFLQASPVLSENALALASFECEPPDNNHEKDRYKALNIHKTVRSTVKNERNDRRTQLALILTKSNSPQVRTNSNGIIPAIKSNLRAAADARCCNGRAQSILCSLHYQHRRPLVRNFELEMRKKICLKVRTRTAAAERRRGAATAAVRRRRWRDYVFRTRLGYIRHHHSLEVGQLHVFALQCVHSIYSSAYLYATRDYPLARSIRLYLCRDK